MKLGETNDELRQIPLTILLADGSGLAHAVDGDSPTVLVAQNNSTLVAAGGILSHVSNEDRLHVYTASADEALVPGFLLVVVLQAGIQTAIGFALVGQTFKLGETDSALLRLPLTIYDDQEPPQLATGATVSVASQLRSSINARAFADDAGSLVEIKFSGTGYGAYYWQAAAAAAAELGAVWVRYERSGFGVCLAYASVDAEATVADPSEPVGPDPIPESDVVGTFIATIDVIEVALDRLPEYLRP